MSEYIHVGEQLEYIHVGEQLEYIHVGGTFIWNMARKLQSETLGSYSARH